MADVLPQIITGVAGLAGAAVSAFIALKVVVRSGNNSRLIEEKKIEAESLKWLREKRADTYSRMLEAANSYYDSIYDMRKRTLVYVFQIHPDMEVERATDEEFQAEAVAVMAEFGELLTGIRADVRKRFYEVLVIGSKKAVTVSSRIDILAGNTVMQPDVIQSQWRQHLDAAVTEDIMAKDFLRGERERFMKWFPSVLDTLRGDITELEGVVRGELNIPDGPPEEQTHP